MAASRLCLHGGVGVATLLLVLESAAWAQVPDPLSPPLPRQPTLQSVQQQEVQQATADRSKLEADRKMREMDRRMNRTLRSVCSGC
jgi:hypothetical protein